MNTKQSGQLTATDEPYRKKIQALIEAWTLAEDAYEKVSASNHANNSATKNALPDALTIAKARLEEDRAAEVMQQVAQQIADLEVTDIHSVLLKLSVWENVTAPEGSTDWLSPVDAIAVSAISDLRRLTQADI